MKRIVSLLLVLVLLLSARPFAGAFSDDASIDDGFKKAVAAMSEKKIIGGFTDGSFKPSETLTRAQAAKILCVMLEGADKANALTNKDTGFADVPASHWAARFVAYCAEKGIVAGVGNGSFNPDGTLTATAFSKMLLVAFGHAKAGELTGGEWLCVSRVPDRLKSREGLSAYVDELRALQKTLDPLGQKLCFHPVAADYAPLDGVVPVEYLLEAMPSLQLCLDLYHLNRSGYAMPDWIRAHAGRICMVHFKDGKDGRLVPAGQGDTDWRGVAQACVEAGVAYGFVEQETWDRDPFECLGEALRWLNGQLGR